MNFSTPKKTNNRKDNEIPHLSSSSSSLSVYIDILYTLITLKFISRPS